MKTALLMDIGSTYTKVRFFDLECLELVASTRAHTTVETDVTIGINKALSQLKEQGVDWEKATYRLACSSAAGGLKMVAIGLVPELTAEAAKRAALGAGAKVLKVFSYELSDREMAEIQSLEPDLILLAGGTDGGNKKVILHNAKVLAHSSLDVPIVAAGNKSVAHEVEEILAKANKDVRVTENVMPELDKLNIEPARETIRQVFLERIIEAKGLEKAQEYVENLMMPTPAAVLAAAQLMADGTDDEEGLGELMVVDVGGATTDVHSLAKGDPAKSGVNLRGLPEPYAKRTVEGDLGMRYSAQALLDVVGVKLLKEALKEMGFELSSDEIKEKVYRLSKDVEYLPQTEVDKALDTVIGWAAVKFAVKRHVGRVEVIYTPFGSSYLQYGKDLTPLKIVIGTGGVIVNHPEPGKILKGAIFDDNDPTLLAPQNPQFWIDKQYILSAVGLLAERDPSAALKIAKKYIKPL
ncbi:MutL protein [Anoxybacter fermentans]|uniref:MutL protein n=1 Tax=Anoxybacter fermentans TaxID=1323375 RepID=A0A3Q9HQK6_9FIRM|nr:methylaspartate mutase accessory protein GlmL [Anoxybacter fermentans]AZR73398.1 MutL protein [Anoxybacter fermentans]